MRELLKTAFGCASTPGSFACLTKDFFESLGKIFPEPKL
jgi:hypothetical protein